MKKSITALVLILAFLLSMLGCTSTTTPANSNSGSSSDGTSSADSAATAAGNQETKFLSFGSFNSGTFQYMYAAAFAGSIKNHVPYLNFTNEATSGTSENLDLLYRGEIGLSVSSPERLYNAYNGIDKYQEKGKLNCGIMWCFMQQASLLFVKADSNIKGFGDLAGKKVCIGAAGSSNETKNSFILDAYGYTRKDPEGYEFNELQTFSIDYTEGASALSDGTVDAIIATQPLPEPSLYELALVTPLKVYGLDPDKFEEIRKNYAWMWDVKVPADTYPEQDALIETLGDPNYIVASLDLVSEEDAYNMTKAYVEKILPQLGEQFDTVKPYLADPSLLMANWVIPGHPGAVKYFKEKGYDVSVIEPKG